MVRGKSRTPADPEEPRERKGNVRIVGLGVTAALLVTFAVLNRGTVTVDFWLHKSRAPVVVVILIAGLLGALITVLAQRFRSRRG
jgi:uncharacterized integral membrane protein